MPRQRQEAPERRALRRVAPPSWPRLSHGHTSVMALRLHDGARWITPDILRVISARLPTVYHTQSPALPPSIDEPLRFTDGSLDRAWRMHFHSHADSDVRLHEARQGDRRMPAAVVARARLSGTFDMDGKGI